MQNMSPEQQAVINFMGTIYGQSRKIDESMVHQSSTLKPSSHVVERVIRDSMSRPIPGIQPTPAELQAAGVGLAPEPPLSGTIGDPTPAGYIGDPIPVVEQQIPVIQQPVYTESPQAPSVIMPTITVEVLEKLDTIIGELRKLNAIIGHEITDSEG
jgi:hypothetical protein